MCNHRYWKMWCFRHPSCWSTHCSTNSMNIKETLGSHLGVGTDGTLALCTGVGTELIKALGANVLLILLHVLLPVQVVTAIVTVKAISHGGGEVTPGTWEKQERSSIALWCSLKASDEGSVAFSDRVLSWGRRSLRQNVKIYTLKADNSERKRLFFSKVYDCGHRYQNPEYQEMFFHALFKRHSEALATHTKLMREVWVRWSSSPQMSARSLTGRLSSSSGKLSSHL